MTYEELTAQQALEIANLKAELEICKACMREITMILCCIGGPLNDNVLGYSKEQLGPLHRINNLAETD